MAHRKDHKHCSNACRQKAKRRREKEAKNTSQSRGLKIFDDYVNGYIKRKEQIRFESIRNYKTFFGVKEINRNKELRISKFRFTRDDIRGVTQNGMTGWFYDIIKI